MSQSPAARGALSGSIRRRLRRDHRVLDLRLYRPRPLGLGKIATSTYHSPGPSAGAEMHPQDLFTALMSSRIKRY